MSHLAKNKTKMINRVRRLRGQIDAIERALEEGVDCGKVLQLIASTRGAINGLMGEVVEDHIHEHVVSPDIIRQSDREQGAQELIDVIRTYLK
jgi:DNA-binding FrmR family transcriptional regulator